LIVAGGGPVGIIWRRSRRGLFTSLPLTSGNTTVTVGDGGSSNNNGQNSSLGSVIATGGGSGGDYTIWQQWRIRRWWFSFR
jgi:hypothetical protein